ncbi:MAG TPA: hydrolase, partial [Burkholderiaceae bacterium]|nr:hydrolase [Burkholderiaceae bacterium]
MARSCVATLALLAVDAQSAQPAQAIDAQSIRIILVGDSTIAPQTGYGDALCRRFQANVTCLNLAKGGRSSASYRAEGS